jgi:predicted Zn-dependent protease
MYIKRFLGAFALVLVPFLAGCSNNPTTGRSQFNMLSRSEEIAIGEEAKGQVANQYGGVLSNAEVQAYLTDLGLKMVAKTEGENPSLPWEFTLLDTKVVNAFALPGGKTFMTRGLAEKLKDEAELAFIMGHEIGHVTARHQNEQISRKIGASVLIAGVAIAAGQSDNSAVQRAVPVLVGGAGGLYLLRFGRGQELEADRLGMRYMVKAGYNPRAARDAMGVLKALASGGQRKPQMLSTHPYPENRIEKINERLRATYAEQVSDKAYGRYSGRYKRYMLQPLAMLPEPEGNESTFALLDTASWCGFCASDAETQAHSLKAQP